MVATSIFFIVIMAEKARLASVSVRGVICQESPQRSLHQPQSLSFPPLFTIAFSIGDVQRRPRLMIAP